MCALSGVTEGGTRLGGASVLELARRVGGAVGSAVGFFQKRLRLANLLGDAGERDDTGVSGMQRSSSLSLLRLSGAATPSRASAAFLARRERLTTRAMARTSSARGPRGAPTGAVARHSVRGRSPSA
jgi:hypothetical protein